MLRKGVKANTRSTLYLIKHVKIACGVWRYNRRLSNFSALL
jgi:hypothetical protein